MSQPDSDGVACPTCGDEFGTRRAMKIHHTRTHGEKIHDFVCEECEEPFSGRPRDDPRFCSPECWYTWKTDPVALLCPVCYTPFEVNQDRATRRVTCSLKCREVRKRGQLDARPDSYGELLEHLYLTEGHDVESAHWIVQNELPGESHGLAEIRDDTAEFFTGAYSKSYNIDRRLEAIRPEDLGLSPLGEVSDSSSHSGEVAD